MRSRSMSNALNALSVLITLCSLWISFSLLQFETIFGIYPVIGFAGLLWHFKSPVFALFPAMLASFMATLTYEQLTPLDPQKAIGYIFTLPLAAVFLGGHGLRMVIAGRLKPKSLQCRTDGKRKAPDH